MFESIKADNYKECFIKDMIQCGALKFGDFITKSGRLSPYFINTGAFNTGALMGRLGAYYAACIAGNINSGNLPGNIDVLFGPAYKGIPLAAVTSTILAADYGMDVGFAFNRKEVKDHGEGGAIVGRSLSDGDNVLVLDDVITAGTAIRETLPIIKSAASVNIAGLIISVDRMERGQRERTAVEEVRLELGIEVLPIITVRDILGQVDDPKKEAIEKYMSKYC